MATTQSQKIGASLLVASAFVGGGSLVYSEPASAAATLPASVKDAVDTALLTIESLDSLALAALAVALTPFGAMLALRFLNMVLSRV